jgi:hypothetical protein
MINQSSHWKRKDSGDNHQFPANGDSLYAGSVPILTLNRVVRGQEDCDCCEQHVEINRNTEIQRILDPLSFGRMTAFAKVWVAMFCYWHLTAHRDSNDSMRRSISIQIIQLPNCNSLVKTVFDVKK